MLQHNIRTHCKNQLQIAELNRHDKSVLSKKTRNILHFNEKYRNCILTGLKEINKKYKMASSVLYTKESKTRLARYSLVVLNEFPEMMQELLLHHIRPIALCNMIEHDGKLNPTEQNNVRLNFEEIKMFQSMYHKGYADVDVTLAYKLLKYFNIIPTPKQKWGRQPRSCDISISDDVERIRLYRNSLCHRASKEVSEADFQKYFTDFIDIGRRFDTFLKKSPKNRFLAKILSLQTDSIDAKTEEKYVNALEEIYELKRKLNYCYDNLFKRGFKYLYFAMFFELLIVILP